MKGRDGGTWWFETAWNTNYSICSPTNMSENRRKIPFSSMLFGSYWPIFHVCNNQDVCIFKWITKTNKRNRKKCHHYLGLILDCSASNYMLVPMFDLLTEVLLHLFSALFFSDLISYMFQSICLSRKNYKLIGYTQWYKSQDIYHQAISGCRAVSMREATILDT